MSDIDLKSINKGFNEVNKLLGNFRKLDKEVKHIKKSLPKKKK